MEYKIEELFLNKNILIIHVSKRLIEMPIAHIFGPKGVFSIRRSSETVQSFVKKLYEIEGITGDIYLKPYEFEVRKSTHSEWKALLPKIIDAMRATIANGEYLTELPGIGATGRYDAASGRA